MPRPLAIAIIVVLVLALLPAARARAATGTFYFHGKDTDQVDKQQALTSDTAIAAATFNTSAPTRTVPITQTTTGIANEDFVGNPLTLYWHGPFSGTVSGQLQLDWFWTSPAPTVVSVTVFADPTYASPRSQPSKVIGRGLVNIAGASVASHMTGAIFVKGTIASELLIQVAAVSLVTGNGIHVFYDSVDTASSFKFVDMPLPTNPTIVFDTSTTLAFAPSTTVSAHFFGAEPQTTLERRLASSQAGRLDPNRIFVDWPLSSRTQTSQLSRSVDGGDSFRLILALDCAERNRPNCFTAGGGDSEDEVNLVNGDLLFADQEGLVVNEAVSSSTDHGDTWPATRQFAVTNAGSGVDRQWLGWSDPSLASFGGRPIEAFFSYHVPAVGVYVLAVTVDGVPIDPPIFQIPEVSQSGNLRVDNTNGPGRGWIYVPYRKAGGYFVATARATDWQLATNWVSSNVTTQTPAIFPWLNLDAHGNAYAVWVAGGVLSLAVSPIDDARNDPTHGGRPGTFWTPAARISPPSVVSAVFPAVTAGDPGRIAITYMGSEDCTPPIGQANVVSDNCQNAATWNTYAAVITDALGLTRAGSTTSVVTGKVNHRVVHRGQVCTSGTTCSGDRSLLDMIDLGVDQDGRVGVVFMDNNNGVAAEPRTNPSKAGPFTQFAKEVAGPSLLAPTGTAPSTISISIPQNGRPDAGGDATWPNVAGAVRLPSLDLTGASVFTSGSDLVARLPLADATLAGMGRDLAAYNSVATSALPADRLQYVFRFSTAEDVYHLSMEYNANGQVRFFGGKLGANDAIQNGTGATVGAGYHTDTAFPVTGTLDHGALTLRAPLAAFTLTNGSSLTGAGAFSMAGPAEAIELTMLHVMRTVDATPPFDATLAPQAEPTVTIECTDPNIQSSGGWHSINDSRADGGVYCRDVGQNSGPAELRFQFTGSEIDVRSATGPRGGILGVSIDGNKTTMDLFRATAKPDTSGRKDLVFGKTMQRGSLGPGTHTVVVTNDSTDANRNIVYVDSFTIIGGDVFTPPGPTVHAVAGMVLGTALAGVDTVLTIVLDPAAQLLDFVIEIAAGTTISIEDPAGKTLATAAIGDGGVIDVRALPDGAGAYALVLHNGTAGDLAFTAWEVVTEQR